MYGRSSAGAVSTSLTPSASVPGSSGNKSKGNSSDMATAILLTIVLGLYMVWALVERHQKVQDAVQPKAIALNLRNLAAILLPVVLGLPLLKVAAAKYKAVGGPFGDVIVSYLGSV